MLPSKMLLTYHFGRLPHHHMPPGRRWLVDAPYREIAAFGIAPTSIRLGLAAGVVFTQHIIVEKHYLALPRKHAGLHMVRAIGAFSLAYDDTRDRALANIAIDIIIGASMSRPRRPCRRPRAYAVFFGLRSIAESYRIAGR